MDPNAIQARGADERGSTATVPESSQAAAGAVFKKVRKLLRDGEIHDARKLVEQAVARYPDYPGLRRTHEVLNEGRSRRRPATGRSIREELGWLRDPPDEYRGKWVAVVGRKVVGTADTLKELVADLPADLEPMPLAVQIAP